MTQALVDQDSQAERLAVDLAMAERQIAQLEMKVRAVEEKAVKAQRDVAGYKATIDNLEVAIEVLKERRLADKQIIRNLRAIIRLRTRLRYPEFTGDPTGRKALISGAADDLGEEFVGQIGTITGVRGEGKGMVLTVEFPDGRSGTFALPEVELNQALITSLEAEAS